MVEFLFKNSAICAIPDALVATEIFNEAQGRPPDPEEAEQSIDTESHWPTNAGAETRTTGEARLRGADIANITSGVYSDPTHDLSVHFALITPPFTRTSEATFKLDKAPGATNMVDASDHAHEPRPTPGKSSSALQEKYPLNPP